ncbi:PREDICTED: protein sprouty-like [Priapulus caudatus]|uniref:Protein sprouty-like n=1 Tax=Priapulus caudatus TaxID=37621 RepID=A0ABM1DXD8_PRICU|nr:PREDICTED: protein sprouty-like [Priapulus caudatus]XP_014664610.1 PREDICTED: protein sprouty-like [Priapulus caudatus]
MAQIVNPALPTGGHFTAVRPTSLPAVHALRATPSPVREVVSLSHLRPAVAVAAATAAGRSQNIYTESPVRSNSHTKLLEVCLDGGSGAGSEKTRQSSGSSAGSGGALVVVDKQPSKTTTYRKVACSGGGGGTKQQRGNNNVAPPPPPQQQHAPEVIICPECGKCRCALCTNPRPLPEKWLCGNKCLCSATQAVDYCTCMKCVKAGFYLCAGDESDSGSESVDEPCSCAPEQRGCARWTCLAALSLALPCLLCYWPLRACTRLAEHCYNCYHGSGCHCQHRPASARDAFDRRLLDPNSDSTG